MNLAQVIHQRWAASAELSALLPPERVFTGLSIDPQVPYAVVGKCSAPPGESKARGALRYNDGSAVEGVRVGIEVFDDDYQRAAAVIDQVRAVFDQCSFDLAGSDKVILMRRIGEKEHQADDGRWQLAVEFCCTVYLAAAS